MNSKLEVLDGDVVQGLQALINGPLEGDNEIEAVEAENVGEEYEICGWKRLHCQGVGRRGRGYRQVNASEVIFKRLVMMLTTRLFL